MKNTIYLFALVFLLSSCLEQEEMNRIPVSITPLENNDGIALSSPEAEAMDADALHSIYVDVANDENLWSIRSLLVLRNDKLVTEYYYKDDNDINTRHLIWSSTKQFMGVLTGIAIDKGLIASINDPISKYLPSIEKRYPDKAEITIRDLITMQSGIGFENDGIGGQTDQVLRQQPDSILHFILSLPMIATPGTTFHYNDGDPQLMSCIIQEITGMPTDEWAEEVLFGPIGLNNYNWVRYKDNMTFGGFGIETTPREMSKFAAVVGNKGQYRDKAIVSNAWLQEMLKEQVESNMESEFGYYWWMRADEGIYFTWGHGGQFAILVPEKELIVVVTAIPNTQGLYQIHDNEVLPYVRRIVNACK